LSRDTKGYTFIELTVVILLVGIMITLITPRIRDVVLTDDLKRTTLRMIGVIKRLRGEAIREQETFFLHFDLETNRFWVDSSSMAEKERMQARENASSFPEGVRVLDVWFKGKGKKMVGETSIRFDRKGYVPQSVIHLGSEDDRQFTLVLSPFLGRVEVLDRYVELEDI